MRKTLNIILFIFLIAFTVNSQIYVNELDSAIRNVEATFAEVNDYTCTLSKKEYIDGDYICWENMIYKFRKPDNYYMKWTEGSDEGQEVLYAGKKYNNKMKVHLGGFWNLINFNIDPKGSLAMKESRHPITESDLGFTIQLMKWNLQKAKTEKDAKIEFLKELTMNNRSAKLYRAEFPENKGFFSHVIYIYLDNLLNLPVKIEMYDWSDRLIESYTFSDLKINVGLNDMDFDAENKSYSF